MITPRYRTLEQAAEELRLRRAHKIARYDRETGRLKGKPIMIEWQGKSQCLADWGRELGISAKVIGHRLSKGYPLEAVFRVGRVRFSESENSMKGHLENSIPGALAALLSVSALHRYSLTGGEVWAILGKNPTILSAIQGLANPKRGRIDSGMGVVRALRILKGREIEGKCLALAAGRWQWITISSGRKSKNG